LPQLGDDLLGFMPFLGHFESSFGYKSHTSGRITFQGEGQLSNRSDSGPGLLQIGVISIARIKHGALHARKSGDRQAPPRN
jgi:hypothetical protein